MIQRFNDRYEASDKGNWCKWEDVERLVEQRNYYARIIKVIKGDWFERFYKKDAEAMTEGYLKVILGEDVYEEVFGESNE